MGGYLKFGIGGCAIVELSFIPDKPTDSNDYGDVQWRYGLKNIELIGDCILNKSKSKYDSWYASEKNHSILKAAGVKQGDKIKIWRKEEMKYKLYPADSDTPFPEPEDEPPPGESCDDIPPDMPPAKSSPPKGTQTTQRREEPVQRKYEPTTKARWMTALAILDSVREEYKEWTPTPEQETSTFIALKDKTRSELGVDYRDAVGEEPPQPEEEFPDDAKATESGEPLEIIDENPFITGKQPSKELCKYWNTLADKENFKLIKEGSGKYTDPENRIVCYWDSKEERVVPIDDPGQLLPF